MSELNPYLRTLGPLEGLEFAGNFAGWNELAKVLAEESADLDHAYRIVEAFVRTPRYNDRGYLVASVPSSIELRLFARTVPKVAPVVVGDLPVACADCKPNGGSWRVVTGKDGITAAARCTCARGEALRLVDGGKPEPARKRKL